MKKQNNAGFSLVELIVTILIMSILTAGVVVSVAAMHRADADKEAAKIANLLEKGRVQTLGRAETVSVKLYADSNGNHIALVQNSVETVVVDLDEKATISYRKNGGVETVLSGTDAVEMEFSKSSGAFKGTLVDYIKVTSDKDLYVCLVADTGRCYIDTTY